NRLGSGSLSLVLEVPRVCEDVWIGFNLAHTPVSLDVSWVRLRWIEVGALAAQPGGFVVTEGPPARVAEQAANVVTTILSNYDAYVRSCDWLAQRWADSQTAEELVKGIIAAPLL